MIARSWLKSPWSEDQSPAWKQGDCILSFAALCARVEETRLRFQTAPARSLILLEGFAPLEAWILTLAAWAEDLCILNLGEEAAPELIAGARASVPWHLYLSARTAASETSHDAQAVEGDLMILSSGSTGQPKAIVHSLEGLQASARATLAFYDFQSGQSWLLSLDPAHIGGLQILVRMWIGQGLCIYQGRPKTVASEGLPEAVDFVSLVPTQLLRLMENPLYAETLRQCRAILLGGAATPLRLIETLRPLQLPVSITYGASEAASQIAALPAGVLPTEAGEVGELLPGWTLHEEGESLVLRGPALHIGLWQNRQWQASDGRWTLPDVGVMKNGRLIITGRRDQIFQVGGENLAPAEILTLIEDLHPAGDLQVYPAVDPEFGHIPLLLIRARQAPDLSVLLKRLERLPGIKRPREIWWLASDDISKMPRAIWDQRGLNPQLKRIYHYERL